MIIYQLHETSVSYSDYTDRIIGSYMRRKRAEGEKEKREKELALIRHCMDCPYEDSWGEDEIDNEELVNQMTKYCDHSRISTDEDGGLICNAYVGHLFDDEDLYIKEVDVEE